MKYLTTISLFIGTAMAANAQEAAIKTSSVSALTATNSTAVASDVLTLTETVFDFGKIPQGKPVTHVFEVINNSKDSLKISNVQASCGCTTPEWEKDKIQAPGEKTRITVGYNAAAEGPFTKYITVAYNGNQNKQITIKGEVWKTPIQSAPDNKGVKSLKED